MGIKVKINTKGLDKLASNLEKIKKKKILVKAKDKKEAIEKGKDIIKKELFKGV